MFFNKKLTIALGIITVFVFGIFLVPAGPVSAAPIPQPKIAFVFSTGGLGDLSFNDAGFVGLQKANTTYNLGVTEADYAEPTDVPEISDLVEQFADDGTYDLILTIGFSSADAVNASALEHPDQKFVIIDMVLGLPNVASVVFNEQEGSFLAGVMAAMTTTSNKVAFLGGEEISLIKKFEAGFQQGVYAIDDTIEVFAQYAPDQTNPWNDIGGGKSVALDFIEKGADVIYAAAGETGVGMFNAVNETNEANGISGTDTKANKPDKIYGIGVDSDQDWTNPGYILTSMIKRVDVAVFDQIKAVVDGTWNGTGADFSNIITLDLEAEGVGISDMTHTGFEKNVDYNGSTRWEVVQAFSDAIIAGDIPVNTAPIVYYTKPVPGFEALFVFFGLGTISIIPLIRRKFKN
ncbi:MAG: BMP family lipoprotein [Candidatus Hodarchaeales archaeon]|jgi:basic membrane protein A